MVSQTAFEYMILALSVSILSNIGIIILVFATGVGKRVYQRFKQKFLYKKGKHINVLFISNNHVGLEHFVKKEEDGSIKINTKPYSANPFCTFNFDGIPTQINFEGIAEPHNLFDDKLADQFSTAELERIILAAQQSDFIAALKKWLLPFFILIGMFGVFMALDLYFGWKNYDTITQKHVFDLLINAAQNATAVAPR